MVISRNASSRSARTFERASRSTYLMSAPTQPKQPKLAPTSPRARPTSTSPEARSPSRKPKQTSLNLKGVYTLDKNWSFTGGYAYNKYDYSDIAYNGYQYTIPYPGVTSSTTQSYLNGYRAFTNSDQNIFYILATYRF